MPVTVLDIPTGSRIIIFTGDSSMDMYKTSNEWHEFCNRMEQIFDIDNTILPFEEYIITQNKHIEPWNKGKSLGKEWSDVRKQHKHTPEQYRKMLTHLQQLRKTLYTEERAQKISNSLKGVPLTEERKQNISQSKVGTSHSEETRNKIATSLRGKKRGPYKKKQIT